MNQKPPTLSLVADRLCGADSGGAHRRAQIGGHARRRRLLDHLLVPALRRAVALTQVDGIAVAVGKDLKFDVTRMADVTLDQHARVAEG
jgi:hypothetical protein